MSVTMRRWESIAKAMRRSAAAKKFTTCVESGFT
jgi:hypothetical protein